MTEKKQRPPYSPEVRERAVRMVIEHGGDYPSQWAAIVSIAGKIGCVPQTLHGRVAQAERDAAAYATREWADGFYHRRLLEPIGNIPPAEAEADYFAALRQNAIAA